MMDGSQLILEGLPVPPPAKKQEGMVWPPDFIGEVERRDELEREIMEDETGVMLAGAMELYRSDPVAFVNDCVWVYEPRNANKGAPVRIPVVTFPQQDKYLRWLYLRFETRTSAPVEKSRDSGASWMACAFAVWLWVFYPGAAAGFGSRKEDYVDRIGDMDTLFEKMRSIIRHLPPYLMPEGFNEKKHFNHMRIINPANGATIKGEAGDNIGRGGRTSIYVVDESAFVERPKLISAALSANTDCRIDISSSRAGTAFQDWCQTSDYKFIFDLTDAPWHTPEWIEAKRAEFEARDELALYKQEFLRDPTAAIEGQLISSEWVQAALNAHIKLGFEPTGIKLAALDVADGGTDRNALSVRHGILITYCESKGGMMADGGGAWGYATAMRQGCSHIRYDSIGVGAGAAAVLRPMTDIISKGWSAAGAVVNPEGYYPPLKSGTAPPPGSRKNKDMFKNAKAQAWWLLRARFFETYKAVKAKEANPHFVVENPEDLISISSDVPEIRELTSELSQVTYEHDNSGKIKIDKAPDGHKSPNRADSVMIAFAPEVPARHVSVVSM